MQDTIIIEIQCGSGVKGLRNRPSEVCGPWACISSMYRASRLGAIATDEESDVRAK